MRSGKGLFIGGTGTEVGKTYFTCLLAQWIRRHHPGIRLHVMKPIESGFACSEGEPDSVRLRGCCPRTPQEKVVVFRYPEPVSPWTAVRRFGRAPVDYSRIQDIYRSLQEEADLVLVEGIGGMASPITENTDNVDLAQILGLPVVVVAPSGLGTLNLCKLTCAYLLARKVSLVGFVLNDGRGLPAGGGFLDLSRESNPEEVEELTGIPVWGRISSGASVLPACVGEAWRRWWMSGGR